MFDRDLSMPLLMSIWFHYFPEFCCKSCKILVQIEINRNICTICNNSSAFGMYYRILLNTIHCRQQWNLKSQDTWYGTTIFYNIIMYLPDRIIRIELIWLTPWMCECRTDLNTRNNINIGVNTHHRTDK